MNAMRAVVHDPLADAEAGARSLLSDLVGSRGLSPDRELVVRLTAERVLVSVLGAVDSLAAKALELEACEARATRHLQGCPSCRLALVLGGGVCIGYRTLARRIDRLQRACDDERRWLERRGT